MNTESSSSKFNRLEELLIESRTRSLTPSEKQDLNTLLRQYPESRAHAAVLLMDDAVLTDLFRESQVEAIYHDEIQNLSMLHALPEAKSQTIKWLQWRPLAAAAAGLVIGCFSTTVVWAINSPSWNSLFRTKPIPIANAGFEVQEDLPQVHLLPKSGQWTGLDTEIVSGGDKRPLAKEGSRMIRLGPAPLGQGYFANLMVDLGQSRPVTTIPLQIEIAVSYHASVPGHNEHYLLRAATFANEAANVAGYWDNAWREMGTVALSSTSKSIFPTAMETGWHTITIRLDAPAQARTLVICLGSNTPGPVEGRTDHYMDDVHATWVIPDSAKVLP